MELRVLSCDESHQAEWNEFVETTCSASVYHRFEWRDINRRAFGHASAYLAAFEGDHIRGIFPLVQVRSRLFGNLACSLPFVNYGGPCAHSPEVEAALVDAAKAVCDRWGVDYLEIRSRHCLVDLPTSEHKLSMTVDLDPDPDVLWKGFATAHRKDIRQGYKRGMTARIGGPELLPDFYRVLSESWRDLGTPIYSRSYLDLVARTFEEVTRVCVVYAGTEPAAASLHMVHGEVAEGLWLGSRAQFRDQHAGYVLYWEIIRDACEHGLKRFHLGRSTVQSGGEVFKKKWRAYPTQLYWQYVLRTRSDIPQLNVSNPKYRLAITTWRHLPLAVTQLVGPLIARSIP